MKEIDAFYNAVKNPSALAATIKKDKKIIGHLCSYTPEELIFAAGLHPMRLFPSKSDITLAEYHLQTYCCSFVRGMLEDSLSGRLDYLDGTVFPHACDSIQRLSDIWRMNGRYNFFADILLPAKLNTQSAGTYLVDVLLKFKKDLEAAFKETITDTDIQKSIKTFNLIRKNLSDLYLLQSVNPSLLKTNDLPTIIKGAMIMDRNQVAELLPAIVANLKKTESLETNPKRVVVSGSICDLPDIYTAIETAGGAVVDDDLCTGRRWFEGQIMEDQDPLTAIADRIIERVTCPAKHTSLTMRGENIVSLAKKNKADGVIFILLKFCDPHAFDYTYHKQCLDKENIKNMRLEIDDSQQNSEQLATRIETFMNMI